jgi:hypothetical protein
MKLLCWLLRGHNYKLRLITGIHDRPSHRKWRPEIACTRCGARL